MNDEELGQRLRTELQARINPPQKAPEAVQEHFRRLSSVQEIGLREAVVPTPVLRSHTLRRLFAVAAAVVIVALVGTGLLGHHGCRIGPLLRPGPGSDQPVPSSVAAAETNCQEFSTSDGGATWSPPEKAPCISSPTFVSSALAYGNEQLLADTTHVSQDGGQTWIDGNLPLPSGDDAGADAAVNLIEQRSDGSLRAMVGWSNGLTVTTIVVSSDGGRTWTTVATVKGWRDSFAPGPQVVSLGQGHWIAFGQANQQLVADVRVTADGGATWIAISTVGLPAYTEGPVFVGASDGCVLAASGTCTSDASGKSCGRGPNSLYSTIDGGISWREILTP